MIWNEGADNRVGFCGIGNHHFIPVLDRNIINEVDNGYQEEGSGHHGCENGWGAGLVVVFKSFARIDFL